MICCVAGVLINMFLPKLHSVQNLHFLHFHIYITKALNRSKKELTHHSGTRKINKGHLITRKHLDQKLEKTANNCEPDLMKT